MQSDAFSPLGMQTYRESLVVNGSGLHENPVHQFLELYFQEASAGVFSGKANRGNANAPWEGR